MVFFLTIYIYSIHGSYGYVKNYGTKWADATGHARTLNGGFHGNIYELGISRKP